MRLKHLTLVLTLTLAHGRCPRSARPYAVRSSGLTFAEGWGRMQATSVDIDVDNG